MSNATEGENIPIEDRAKQMPDPTGWKILCAVPEIDDRFEGTDIVRPHSNKTQEQFATVVLFVVKLGPDAYKDTDKYPSGPWCKEGDFIIARQYSGTRLLIHGKEFRVLYDDQVEAVVQDPRGISRV
jgi:co-chaperonin GroES (HSP10)